MQAIIVDDEPRAIELLKGYLQHFEQVKLVATFRNALKALEFLNKEPVDLIFLDINMPQLSGISLSKILPEKTKIIFTTAYSEYAVESYEVNAVDYLLKPISLERFSKAIQKVFGKPEKTRNEPSDVIYVKSGSKTHRIDPTQIFYLEKDGNYMTYFLENQKVVARESIAEALLQLPSGFMQVHKSYIINTNKIEFFEKDELSINGVSIPVGASFKEEVKGLFQ